jgi:hypothetical protein
MNRMRRWLNRCLYDTEEMISLTSVYVCDNEGDVWAVIGVYISETEGTS